MGATVSKSKQKILVDSMSSIVSEVTTTYITNNTNKIASIQYMTVNGDYANFQCGDKPFDISQTNNVQFSVLSTNKNDASTTMTNDILNQITAALENKSNQSISGLNLGQAAVNIQDQNIQQQIRTYVKNSVNSTIENMLTNQLDSNQGMTINLKGATVQGEGCSMTQVGQIAMFSDQAAQNMVDNAIANKLITVVDDQAVAENKQTLTGVSLLGLIGGGAFGFIGFVLILYIIYTVIKKKNDK